MIPGLCCWEFTAWAASVAAAVAIATSELAKTRRINVAIVIFIATLLLMWGGSPGVRVRLVHSPHYNSVYTWRRTVGHVFSDSLKGNLAVSKVLIQPGGR